MRKAIQLIKIKKIKNVTSMPVDIPMQTVKNSGPSEPKAVQG
jgi:hypothetical protein